MILNCPELMKDTNPQIQETQVSSRIHTKSSTPRFIIGKFQSTAADREKSEKQSQGKDRLAPRNDN